MLDDVMASGYTFHRRLDTLSLGDMKQVYAELIQAFPDASWTFENLLDAEGDTVVAHGTFRGTQGAPFGGIGAGGQHVAVTFLWLYRLSEGKIQEGWEFMDGLALVQQIGGQVVPACAIHMSHRGQREHREETE
jgi:predicted ester cyclase